MDKKIRSNGKKKTKKDKIHKKMKIKKMEMMRIITKKNWITSSIKKKEARDYPK